MVWTREYRYMLVDVDSKMTTKMTWLWRWLDPEDDLTLKMNTAKGVEKSVNTTNTNSPSQDYTNLDDQHLPTCIQYNQPKTAEGTENIFHLQKYITNSIKNPRKRFSPADI